MGIEAKSVAIWIFTTAVSHLTGGRECYCMSAELYMVDEG